MVDIWCRFVQCNRLASMPMQKTQRVAKQAREMGDRVRARRIALRMSQEDLGEVAGLHRTYIGHLERGGVNASLLNILKVSAALDIDASELVTGLAATIGNPRLA